MSDNREDLMSLCRRRGIVYPSFEIYGGLGGFIDYGPVGVRLKKNIENLLRQAYVVELGCLEVECNTLHPIDVFKASGHLDSFSDAIVECEKCGQSYRADHLILDEKGVNVEGKPIEEIQAFLDSMTCPKCGGRLGKAFPYHLMFETSVGPGARKVVSFLRPETAQSTYTGFQRLWEYARKTLPFAVLQIGRSFRNEISPRQGMIRLREFSQAEIQFFFDPENLNMPGEIRNPEVNVKVLDLNGAEHEVMLKNLSENLVKHQPIAYHLAKAVEVFSRMGVDEERMRLRQHREDERSFYSKDTWDVEYLSESYGWVEMVGIAYRTDYDLGQHMKVSKERMDVNVDGRRFIPHVVEVAYGIDRPIYCTLESGMDERGFKFTKEVAPYNAAVFPLVKKDGISEKAQEVYEKLAGAGVYSLFDKAGSIGKRYARADEIGIPYCITVDYETMKDDTVTVRKRSDMMQERVGISGLTEYLNK
ncbi:MAG TPA: glycine--tRNA ligase [Candidatus Altiarchaeales archaeon]|nr:glycine--tRNA ligase [Candidatus Altiarchaeales archaeon]